jgi:hypothetical protein
MCAYNVRKNRSIDHQPAKGAERTLNLLREAGIWLLGAVLMYAVYWLARRFLFY